MLCRRTGLGTALNNIRRHSEILIFMFFSGFEVMTSGARG